MKQTISIIFILIGLGLATALVLKPQTVTGPHNTPPPPPVPATTTLFFAGDIMLSRNVGGKMIAAQNYALPFEKVAERIQQTDISFANLESPALDVPPFAQQGLIFKADPKSMVGLKSAGFDILSTANNHAYDQGRDGIVYTLDWLKINDILPLGTGLDCHNGQIITKNNIRFGFLAYSYAAFNDGGKIPDPWVCDWNDLEQINKDIALLKPKVDFLIVSSHMGAEYKREPETANRAAARAVIDAGADMFVGHHPHWVQTLEQYNGKYIFYSLGNFVFDQMWSQDTREGITVFLTFKDKAINKIELAPIVIDDFCCPRWANEQETKSILGKINLTSPVLIDQN